MKHLIIIALAVILMACEKEEKYTVVEFSTTETALLHINGDFVRIDKSITLHITTEKIQITAWASNVELTIKKHNSEKTYLIKGDETLIVNTN